MCGRYGFSIKDKKELYDRFDVYNELADLDSRYNIAPGQHNPVITKNSPNKIQTMLWGFIPFWAKDDSFKFKTINARIEGLDTKPTYKKAFRFQRCLVPASFFFEWDKSQKPSQPYLFEMKNKKLFAFAGLYDIWKNPDTKQEVLSYTIITTQANSNVEKIHPRMPVILDQEHEEDWLNPDVSEYSDLYTILSNMRNQELISFPVSSKINKSSSDEPSLIKRLE